MHLDEQYAEWQRNSLIHMKSAEDWKPVWLGVGLLAFIFALVFIKFYLENQNNPDKFAPFQ